MANAKGVRKKMAIIATKFIWTILDWCICEEKEVRGCGQRRRQIKGRLER